MTFRKMLSRTREGIKGAVLSTQRKIRGAGVHKHVGTVAETAVAVTGKVQKFSTDALDAVTRKDIDDQVREHILLQNHYNDVLALRLQEALERIEKLERKIGK